MKIIQMLPCLNYGDAIGNDTIALYHALKENHYDTVIFSEAVDQRLPSHIAKTMDSWKKPAKDDVIVYHLSVDWKYINKIVQAKCRKIAIYHNITPGKFFKGYDEHAFKDCQRGLEEIGKLKNVFDYIIADSQFNKNDLISYGFKCKIDVLPVLISFEDYKKKPSKTILEKYKNAPGHNILFVGRIAPNKKQEDVIAAFSLYKKYYDPAARLFLVGNYNRKDRYYRRLQGYVDLLHVKDVYFSGHIKFNEIIAYYCVSDLLLCMSEHEGFCVPLVESMYFKLPVIAYDSSAIKETLGGSGIVFEKKDYNLVAALMNRVLTDEPLRKQMIEDESKRLTFFDNNRIKGQFITYLNQYLARSSAKER